jgi:hypothetical protein
MIITILLDREGHKSPAPLTVVTKLTGSRVSGITPLG